MNNLVLTAIGVGVGLVIGNLIWAVVAEGFDGDWEKYVDRSWFQITAIGAYCIALLIQ